MGCFSFMCKECGKAILSNSYRGQPVKLFLLKDGEVIEQLEGEYDSYGRVFADENMTYKLWERTWDEVCELMFDKKKDNGIAAVHVECFNGTIPTIRSKQDPNQGWGSDGYYLFDTDNSKPL